MSHTAEHRSLIRAIALTALVVVLLTAGSRSVARAQTSSSFDLTWHVVANGGGVSSSANYRIKGTIGQAAAGPPVSASSSFVVTAGYWVAALRTTIFLPLVLRG